jgi:hypothetical protein
MLSLGLQEEDVIAFNRDHLFPKINTLDYKNN